MKSLQSAPPPPAPIDIQPLSVRIPIATRMTGIGRSKLYQLIKAREIETVKIGSSTLIPVESLRQLMERQRR